MNATAAALSPSPEVPAAPEQLTPEWMTAALAGAVSDLPAVTAVQWEPAGAGLGFAGEVVRLRLTYERDADAPTTLIAKFPARHSGTRELLSDFGGYEREVRFYSELAGDAGLPAPVCYYHGYNEADGSFILLLEDLAASRLGDQVAGSTAGDAGYVVKQLARFHARHWNRADLLQQPWLHPSPAMARRLPELFDRGLGPLRENFTGRYHDVLRLVDRLVPLVPDLAASFGDQFPPRPFALVHGDVRMDNLFFPSVSGGRFAVLDWQGVAIGSPANELAYFLILSLPVDVRRAHESSLIGLYHDELRANGVADYSLGSLRRDYARGILIQLLGLPILSANLDFTSERGQALSEAALERLSAAAVDLKASRIIAMLTWYVRAQRLLRLGRRKPATPDPPSPPGGEGVRG